ncbi:hypothetical protein TVAG_439050 [Trichomonas vaginalis G3]|uniref:DUF3447 domain-containing protein n=1 Tax=Trichomonas vaginalis (strain ATCC PRA-98 / G3) TaxID=412133 RepID=A2FQX2_TRIV3|nr:spectrin binding [Trichomonas vaginalis G3]EAX92677.1 hypothetical protein TVAG_439050 [Trichomonas vaginalis G3]KAI5552990.1 spectrin binding [Trichomonas vaginalis G3]|eukprot:XP_001305607.1 hypothetical protein [Trichomonas vaginalis G3]
MKDILDIIPYNNRYLKSYLTLAKFIFDDYNVKEVKYIPLVSKYMFYKQYGIKLDTSDDFEKNKSENLDIHSENTIYRAIINNDLETFIAFTERDGFDESQKLLSNLYPDSKDGNDKNQRVHDYSHLSQTPYSLLELCCYHGARDATVLRHDRLKIE